MFPDWRPVEGVGDVEEEEEGAEKTVEDDTQQNTLQQHIITNLIQPRLGFQLLGTFRREKQYINLSSLGITQDIIIRSTARLIDGVHCAT